MAAPKGNEYYKLREINGRPPIFDSPEQLAEKASEYFKWADEHPLMQTDFRGKDAIPVQLPHPRPYTITGLCIFIAITEPTFRDYEKKEGFSLICTRIREIIYNQKFEGAATGFYNANIIARDLGLRDAKDVNIDSKRKAIQDLFPDELDGEEDKP